MNQSIKNFGSLGNASNLGNVSSLSNFNISNPNKGVAELDKQAVRKKIDDWILKQREKGFAHNVAVFDEKGNFRAYGDAVFMFPKSSTEIIVDINKELTRLKLTENQTKANPRKV